MHIPSGKQAAASSESTWPWNESHPIALQEQRTRSANAPQSLLAWQRRGGILSSRKHMAPLYIGRCHGREENWHIKYLFAGWAAGSHSCESRVAAGCLQRQEEHLAPLPESRAGFPTLCTPLPSTSHVLPSGASTAVPSLQLAFFTEV